MSNSSSYLENLYARILLFIVTSMMVMLIMLVVTLSSSVLKYKMHPKLIITARNNAH